MTLQTFIYNISSLNIQILQINYKSVIIFCIGKNNLTQSVYNKYTRPKKKAKLENKGADLIRCTLRYTLNTDVHIEVGTVLATVKSGLALAC